MKAITDGVGTRKCSCWESKGKIRTDLDYTINVFHLFKCTLYCFAANEPKCKTADMVLENSVITSQITTAVTTAQWRQQKWESNKKEKQHVHDVRLHLPRNHPATDISGRMICSCSVAAIRLFFFLPAISLSSIFFGEACLLSAEVFFCSHGEISRCKSVQQHKVDLVSCAEARHSQTAAIRMIAPYHMLFYIPSTPLWGSARPQGLVTPLEWAEVLTLLPVSLPDASQGCFPLCSLKIWPGATSDVWKWIIKHVRTPQRVSADMCSSWIWIFWQAATRTFA